MIVVLPKVYEDSLGELITGDCFELYGAYYMVTDGAGMYNPVTTLVCVNLVEGSLQCFMKNEKVKRLPIEAHISEV